jgi:hypothetical protein
LKAAVARGKAEISSKDARISTLQSQLDSKIQMKYVPSPKFGDNWINGHLYLGTEEPCMETFLKHQSLHVLKGTLLRYRSKVDKVKIKNLMKYFQRGKKQGGLMANPVDSTKCGYLAARDNKLTYQKSKEDSMLL